MNAHASNLDIEKFRKVWALTDKGATDGEREAAMARAEAIAAKAGMSIVDAVAAMNSAAGAAKATARSTMSWEEYWEAERPKREAQFAAAERQYGPAEEAFAETMEEAKLRAFLEPFATYRKFDNANGDSAALDLLRAGERQHPRVKRYYDHLGILLEDGPK